MNRRLFALFLVVLASGGWASAQTPAPGLKASRREVRRDVIAVIDAQLAAFRSGDPAEAYRYAAANLRAQTPPRTFAAIVRENYPIIWANTRADYGIVRDDGTHAAVLVHVHSQGGSASYDYVLIRERGGWRIGSVTRHEIRQRDNV